jgi:hypothetical protein
MKTSALLILTTYSLLAISTSAFAEGKILAKDSDNKAVVFAQDKKGTPRINGNLKTYPTIKDFSENSDYSEFCFVGTFLEAKELLSALVDAANGDGDSWAELNSIKKASNGTINVDATIIDESGENEESYDFTPCK